MIVLKFIFFLFLMPIILIAGDDIDNPGKKVKFHLQAGVHYKNFIDDKYIEPTSKENQFERFNKIPTYGYSLGFLLTFKLDKSVNLTTGLQYFLRRSVFESNRDTIIKFHNGTHLKNIRNVFEYDYSFNNIEIPILFTWSYNKLLLYTGFNLSIISYKKGFYNYIVNQYPNVPQWTAESKTLYGFETLINFYPTIQASYQFQVGKFKLNPFIGFYYALEQQDDFYFQMGINIPMICPE